jgi:phosphatidylglycerol---prolipoprotein diacylglyceryl transferase
MINFPNINPIAFTIADFPIHWYGIAYAIGIYLASLTAQKLCRVHRNTPINEKHIDGIFSYIVIGIILGGRLGYVLFYNPSYFLANPHEIIEIWNGGMSFHGGFIGVLIACMIYKNRWGISFIYLTDRIAPGACLGLMLGRIANFVNGELWGRASDVPWAMVFPQGGDVPRHPSQIYEAFFEGLVLYLILYAIAKRTNRQGVVSSCFLIGYGLFRFIIEFTRQPDNIKHLHEGIFQYITMGQLLCLPMIGLGVFMLYKIYKNKKMLDDSIKNAYKEAADNNNSTKFMYEKKKYEDTF